MIVCDGEGKPFPGGESKPISEDTLDAVVEWDTASLMDLAKGRSLRFRFELKMRNCIPSGSIKLLAKGKIRQ